MRCGIDEAGGSAQIGKCLDGFSMFPVLPLNPSFFSFKYYVCVYQHILFSSSSAFCGSPEAEVKDCRPVETVWWRQARSLRSSELYAEKHKAQDPRSSTEVLASVCMSY